MVRSFGKDRQDSLARTNWWLIGAVFLGLSFWAVVVTAGKALIG